MRNGGEAQGFTLIELAVVLAILGVLAALAVVKYGEFIERARAVKAVVDIRAAHAHIRSFEYELGRLPDSLTAVGLDTLRDPWDRPYEYLRIAGAVSKKKIKTKIRKDRLLVPLNTDYDMYSKGKDGLSAAPVAAVVSLDDVIRASNGRYIGLARRY